MGQSHARNEKGIDSTAKGTNIISVLCFLSLGFHLANPNSVAYLALHL